MLGDLSEMGYGVSLVSSWKYGYAVEGNVMRSVLMWSFMTLVTAEQLAVCRFYGHRLLRTLRPTEESTSSRSPSCLTPVTCRMATPTIRPWLSLTLFIVSHVSALDPAFKGMTSTQSELMFRPTPHRSLPSWWKGFRHAASFSRP